MYDYKSIIYNGWTISSKNKGVLIDILKNEDINWADYYLYDYYYRNNGDPYEIFEKNDQEKTISLCLK